MTISAQGVRAVYPGNGTTGPFTLQDADAQDILFADDAEIIVTRYDADNDPTPLVQGVDYTITGEGAPTAGAVTLTDALAVGETLVLLRVTARTQLIDLIAGGKLSMNILEGVLDKFIRIDQEDREAALRSVQMHPTYVGDQQFFPEPNESGDDDLFIGYVDGVLSTLTAPTVLRSGDGPPSGDAGNDGDFYIDTAASPLRIYGPREEGLWGAGTSLQGPVGPTGPTGDQGPPGDLSQATADTLYQPLDGDLTAIAALITTAYGRSLLALADDDALAAEINEFYQPLDSDLTAIAALTTTAFGRSVLALANAAALATLAGVGTGDSPQFTAINVGAATDTTITRVSAGVIAVEGNTVLTSATGQPLDADLTAIAALSTNAAGRSLLQIADPNQDTIYFWDDSAGQFAGLNPLGGLQISGTDLRALESIVIAASDETTNITAGTNKVTWRMPYAFTLTAVRASVNTAPTGSTIIIDINEGGTTILSTKLSIDASELTSTTAASAAVISDTALADDAAMSIDFDQVGSSTPGRGVKVTLLGFRP